MEELSENKKEYLENIGIDLNNIPEELNKYSQDMESNLDEEELKFIQWAGTTGTFRKQFSLRDIAGTTHPNYMNKTWFQIFKDSKRGDYNLELLKRNPEYYNQLKQENQEQTNQDLPIELIEVEGKFYIDGGNNRMSIMMMKYLSELSKAKTQEERDNIDKDNTFFADVRSTPKDRELMYMINMIRDNTNIRIKNVAQNPDECKYIVKLGDKDIEINSKEDLENITKDCLRLDKIESNKDIYFKLSEYKHIVNNGGVRVQLIDKLYPDMKELLSNFEYLKSHNKDKDFIEKLNLDNSSIKDVISQSKKLIEDIKEEEQKQNDEIKGQDSQDINVVDNKQKEAEIPNMGEAGINDLESRVAEKIDLSILDDSSVTINEYGEIIRNNPQIQERKVEPEKISFRQKIVQFFQNNKLLKKLPFVSSLVNKDVKALPEVKESAFLYSKGQEDLISGLKNNVQKSEEERLKTEIEEVKENKLSKVIEESKEIEDEYII